MFHLVPGFVPISSPPPDYEYYEEAYPTESEISTLSPLETVNNISTTSIKKQEALKCKNGWIEVHKNLDVCFFKGKPTVSKVQKLTFVYQ